jgi:hypothetical protein
MKVYLSYTNDGEYLAQRIRKELENRDIQVWSSRENIIPGEVWINSILRAIEASDAFLPIITKNSYSSSSSNSEITLALSSQKRSKTKKIIPILAEKTSEIPFFLKDIQYADFSNKDLFNEQLSKLVFLLKSDRSINEADQEFQLNSKMKYLNAEIESLKSQFLENERKRYRTLKQITTFLSSFVITLTTLLAIWYLVNEKGTWPTYILVVFVIIVLLLFIVTFFSFQGYFRKKNRGKTEANNKNHEN